jgi:hypothetical protein
MQMWVEERTWPQWAQTVRTETKVPAGPMEMMVTVLVFILVCVFCFIVCVLC